MCGATKVCSRSRETLPQKREQLVLRQPGRGGGGDRIVVHRQPVALAAIGCGGEIDDGGALRTGEFLRVGRIALMFKTADDSVLKIWDKDQNGWIRELRSEPLEMAGPFDAWPPE
mgnify:CR=1 FL=1